MEKDLNDLALWKSSLKLRLAAQAEKLVGHIEGLPKPETPLEAERMAKALKAADAAIEQIFKGDDETPDDIEEEDMNDDWAGRDWRAELEHKLNRLVAARRWKRRRFRSMCIMRRAHGTRRCSITRRGRPGRWSTARRPPSG